MFNFNFTSHDFKSPGYLKCSLPENVKKEVERTIKMLNNNEVESKDYRENLAGHLQKETSFPITEKLKYLVESLCDEYVSLFLEEDSGQYHGDCRKQLVEDGYEFKHILRSLWINYGKKHDFNPIHHHHGKFSFVLWVKIPYRLEDEDKVYPYANGTDAGRFAFIYPQSNSIYPIANIHVPSVEWDLILFPATLSHSVYPYFTSDEERVSISGNIYFEPVKSKKKKRKKK